MDVTDKYVYLIDGEPSIGTLDDYAHAQEMGAYSGIDVSAGLWVITVPPKHITPVLVEVRPEVTTYVTPDDHGYPDYREYRLICGDDEASYRIDLRA